MPRGDTEQIDIAEAWAVPECHLLRSSTDKQIYVSSPRRSTVLKFINKAVIGAGAPMSLKGPQQPTAWVTAWHWLHCVFDCVPTAICSKYYVMLAKLSNGIIAFTNSRLRHSIYTHLGKLVLLGKCENSLKADIVSTHVMLCVWKEKTEYWGYKWCNVWFLTIIRQV